VLAVYGQAPHAVDSGSGRFRARFQRGTSSAIDAPFVGSTLSPLAFGATMRPAPVKHGADRRVLAAKSRQCVPTAPERRGLPRMQNIPVPFRCAKPSKDVAGALRQPTIPSAVTTRDNPSIADIGRRRSAAVFAVVAAITDNGAGPAPNKTGGLR
jgi:hypothetical protein